MTTSMTAEHVRATSSTSTGYVSQWKTTSPAPLTRESLLDLLNGSVPVIKVSKFVSEDTCQKVVSHLMPKFNPYLHATGPAVDKVGLAQFEFQAQSEEDFKNRTGNEKSTYFTEAQKFRDLHTSIATATSTPNLCHLAISTIAALVPEYDVCIASESPTQQYHSGIFRSINHGTPPHCDWCPYDCLTEDWVLSRITHQCVFNLYLTSVRGGGTTTWDIQWTPEALTYRDPQSYGYHRGLIEGRESCQWTPEPGLLAIFNSRNIHEVKPVEKDGTGTRRIALASFMGVLPEEVSKGRPKLMFWS